MEVPELEFADLSKFKKKGEIPPFPFVRIVGQQSMKKALLLAASNPSIKNLLLMGEAGIGKGTAAKGLKFMLPEIVAVRDCQYNCNPADPEGLCQACKDLKSKGELKSENVPMPFQNIPVGASRKRIFGDFDHTGKFKPGLVGKANRGYLLIEKVNILDQKILAELLAIAESGAYSHETEVGAFMHPARFSIIGTMNPEDGDLDEGLLEKFSMAVSARPIKDIEERIEVVRRVEAYKQDPSDFMAKSQRETEAFKKRVENARKLLKRADVPKKVHETIEKVAKRMEQDNEWVRSALEEAALANAVFNDRIWVTVDDVAEIGEMVLGHRGKE
jgi:Mg-chelatase subunit ChlI